MALIYSIQLCYKNSLLAKQNESTYPEHTGTLYPSIALLLWEKPVLNCLSEIENRNNMRSGQAAEKEIDPLLA